MFFRFRPASISLLFATFAHAQSPVLVKDIGPAGSGEVSDLTCRDGKVYFRANDGSHGRELWISDGTTAGTFMLKDLNPGPADGYPGPFVVFNDLVYFGADDGVNGEQLWMTDGTPGGTAVVPNVTTDFISAMGFTEFNGELYFAGNTDATGSELWATDGTVAGTHLVKDIHPGVEGSYPAKFIPFNGKLFFAANDGVTGKELWATDGTADGTTLIANLQWEDFDSNPTDFAVLGDQLLFAAYTGSGNELWATDGTTEGTALLKDINPGGDSSPQYLVTFNGRTYFRAFNTAAGGVELWVTDGTTEGTQVFMDINPGSLGSNPADLCVFNGKLYFSALTDDEQLWSTDGTVGNTTMIAMASSTVDSPLGSTNAIIGCGTALFYDARYDETISEELYSLATPMAIDEMPTTNSDLLWPNPATNMVHMTAGQGQFVSLIAADGRMISAQPAASDIDISTLADGVYVVRVTDRSGTVLNDQRLVKLSDR